MRGEAWQRPVAAVLNTTTKRPEGTAFLVMPDLALTCAHVVEDATRGGATDTVTLRFHFLGDAGLDAEAKIVADRARTGADIAVLRLAEPAKLAACEPYRLRPPNLANGPLPFRSWGYPKGYDSGDEAHARITGPTPTGLRAVHEPDHPRFLEKGFSGAPAARLTPEGTALAAGMAVTVDKQGQPIGELLSCERLLAALRLCTEPYRLLRPFGVSDRHLFFGRDRLVETLLDDPTRKGFAVLTGPSGSGKSSVLRAGLIPRRADQDWAVLLIGATESLEQLATHLNCGADADSILRHLVERARDPARQGVFLAIDQAEEMFPAVPPGLEPPALALARLLADAREELAERLCVALAIRSDFLDRLLALAPLRRSVERGIAFVDPLDEAALTDAIERPAELLGVRFDAGLVRRIVRDVQTGAATLPMLQVGLHRMWQALDGEVMRTAAYEALQGKAANGVLGAMAAHASEAVAGLPGETLEAVLLEMVEPGARRRRLFPMSRFTPEERAVITRLEEQQLVERRMDTRGVMVTLAHDSLITAWPILADLLARTREFRVWLEDMRSQVRKWKAAPDQLLQGSALQVARGMAEQYQGLLAREIDIVKLMDASFDAAAVHEHNERKRQELMLREAEERAEAERNLRHEAETRTREAQLQESRAIAIFARQASEQGDHMTAMLAALEVLPDPEATPPARLRA